MSMKKRILSLLLAGAICATTMLSSTTVLAIENNPEQNLTQFEQEFKNPDNDAKAYSRWWINPGRMPEEEVRRLVRLMADSGIGGVELVSLDPKVKINTPEWNEYIKWILEEAKDCGIQVDFTLGQLWPIATPDIIDINDERAEQALYFKDVDFNINSSNMVYQSNQFQFPDEGFDQNRTFKLTAITAAKKLDTGNYDPASAVNLMDISSGAIVDTETGAVKWTAPTEGNWSIFYMYQQSTGKTVGSGFEEVVINHMDIEATKAVIKNWEDAMNDDPELTNMYEENGGSIFGDSLELGDNLLWTTDMLSEFKERRGYDLTPYLPTISMPSYWRGAADIDETSNYEFEGVGYQIRLDVYKTMTELYTENHVSVFRDWAHSHNMTLRYQGSYNAQFEITESSLASDITETEAWGHKDTIDAYRLQSGVAHMKGDQIYSSESAETNTTSWRQTWTGSDQKNNNDPYTQNDPGLFHYINRLFVTGVNKNILHGFSGKVYDLDGLYYPEKKSWPGYGTMCGMGYSNEWDDKTPLWEVVKEMTDYMSRAQMVLQQGQGDIDLAMYRLYYRDNYTGVEPEVTDLEYAGYSYDYITPALLELPNATVGINEGQTVLAPYSLNDDGTLDTSSEGQSYKALVLDQRMIRISGKKQASDMPLDTARQILEYAKSGLPIFIVGKAPTRTDSYPGSDEEVGAIDALESANQELQAIMETLQTMTNVKTVSDRTELISALEDFNILPDAAPEEPSSNLFYHRTTEEAELYYIYNNSLTEATQQTITFQGEGFPYLLDPWSGEITPIAEYTKQDDQVTMEIELEPGDTKFIAIAKPGWSSKQPEQSAIQTDADSLSYDQDGNLVMHTTLAGNYTVTLSDGNAINVIVDAAENPINLNHWEMTLHEWAPLLEEEDWVEPDDYLKTQIIDKGPYTLTELVPWYEISEDLARSGGIGEYNTSFELEKGWKEGQGAILKFTQVSDGMKLYVNGAKVWINQFSNQADIGPYLVSGTNTIKVEVNSSLANYKFGTTDSQTYAFGIIGEVTLTPYIQTEVNTVETNKSILNSVIAYADAAKESGEYDDAIESVQKSFDEALENAKTVAADKNASQEVIDEAWKILLNEIHKLGFVAGDKTELASLIAAAEEIDLSKYIETGQAEFTAALKAAQKIYQDGDAMQVEINEVADNLLNAMLNLRFKADKSILEEVVQEAEKVDANAYTEESYAVLQSVVEKAKEVIADENATQEQVDAAVSSVQEAMKGLVAVERPTTETPADNNADGTQAGQEITTTKANAARTGDFTPIAGVMALALAGAALLLTYKRK